jgi:NAD(P)-dependent dehydrogenase (short-subunit alcohol dehydrogenase family)
MVSNAGITVEMGEHGNIPVWVYDECAFGKTMEVDVKGVFFGVKHASKQMLAQERRRLRIDSRMRHR